MSTFDGFIHEFPDIRVDFFRLLDRPPALVYFLSHVHSDHLAGLDTFRSPFIYCSAATRAILLRLKKTACRLNYAKGILENPRMQVYKHLEKVLKPIPLDTPTVIELRPSQFIRVTLLDANHCIGAVMFLFEADGKAVLYTGDMRCEARLITTITQNPSMIEYSSGLKTLDKIYLDTSILKDYRLPTKAEGLCELIDKVSKYPENTLFHFSAWTYGYEEVWIALSKALNTKIHVDQYKMDVYRSLATKANDNRWATQTHLAKEAPFLVGFTCGNNQQKGCLTLDNSVRLHSCEKDSGCTVVETGPVVWIQPIVTHLKDGKDVMEVGLGGGGDDLEQGTALSPNDILSLFHELGKDEHKSPMVTELLQKLNTLKGLLTSGRDVSLDIDIPDTADDTSQLVAILASLVRKLEAMQNPIAKDQQQGNSKSPLPNIIRFPYSRHSSLPELRSFVHAFKPKDIWPCTFEPRSWFEQGVTIGGLFGDCCSGGDFSHDAVMAAIFETLGLRHEDEEEQSTQQTACSRLELSSPVTPSVNRIDPSITMSAVVTSPQSWKGALVNPTSALQPSEALFTIPSEDQPNQCNLTSMPDVVPEKHPHQPSHDMSNPGDESDFQDNSQTYSIPDRAFAARRQAFRAAQANLAGDMWEQIHLISTTDHHSYLEKDLGSD
ncbi:hypothetical protein F5Y15DRAFT_25527 [Xylariaceae sp. FL0016]|nr:hypothetical protein F5Y15DRAFT_25527 [Xylariaceae sp. FL0016]